MNPKTQPKTVEADNSAGRFTVTWADGHVSEYSLFGLRKNCPCVECRGGHGQMDSFDRSQFFQDPTRNYKIDKIKQVGNHAIRIFWNDGHSSGMYQWETLRSLCPCEECYPEQE